MIRTPSDEAGQHLIQALGRQSAFWGVGKVPGQIYAVLYLSPEPATLADLARTLGVSKAAVSVSARVLEQLGMVRRILRSDDRRVFFEAETDFWLVARRVLERRQKPEFDESLRMVGESLELARRAPRGADRAFTLSRLESLSAFYRNLDGMVASVLRLDPRRLARVLRLLAGAAPSGRGGQG